MGDETLNPALDDVDAPNTVVDPDEVQIPKEVAERMSQLIDAARVIMMVGTEKEARPMNVCQIFQEMFAVMGDLDKRLTAIEKGGRPSGLILPN